VFDVVTKYIDGICGGCGNHCVPRQLPVIKNFGGLAYQARLLLTFGRMRDRETIEPNCGCWLPFAGASGRRRRPGSILRAPVSYPSLVQR
jgi:hypothetical protein